MSIKYNGKTVAGKYKTQIITNATPTQSGIIRIATKDEVTAGANNTVAVTPKHLSNKVDKEDGKSLISDTEIVRLSGVTNYDDTEIKEAVDGKASKLEYSESTLSLLNSNNEILDSVTIESSSQVNIDNKTINYNKDNLIQTIGNYTVNNIFKNEWIGTLEEYNKDLAEGIITKDTECRITDDEDDIFSVLTNATNDKTGLVKPDGVTITIDESGTISANISDIDTSNLATKDDIITSYNDLTDKPTIPDTYTLPVATTDTLGGVKPDGETIVISEDGVISSLMSGANVTNCLTETNRNFEYEYNTGTTILTVKAGARVVFPCGINDLSSQYPTGTIVSDYYKVIETEYTQDGKFFVHCETIKDINNELRFTATDTYTAVCLTLETPQEFAVGVYAHNSSQIRYDYNNNYISTWQDGYVSFPLFMFNTSGIVPFYNVGFMLYDTDAIGCFTYGNIKGLASNGFDNKGVVKNTEILSNKLVFSDTIKFLEESSESSYSFYLTDGYIKVYKSGEVKHDSKINKLINFNDNTYISGVRILDAKINNDSSIIISDFDVKKPFITVTTTPPIATVDNVGLVKPDGTTITIADGVISAKAQSSGSEFTSSKNTNSWLQHTPSGLMIQGGGVAFAKQAGTVTITFPKAFATKCCGISTIGTAMSVSGGDSLTSLSNTSATIWPASTLEAGTLYWIAFGY